MEAILMELKLIRDDISNLKLMDNRLHNLEQQASHNRNWSTNQQNQRNYRSSTSNSSNYRNSYSAAVQNPQSRPPPQPHGPNNNMRHGHWVGNSRVFSRGGTVPNPNANHRPPHRQQHFEPVENQQDNHSNHHNPTRLSTNAQFSELVKCSYQIIRLKYQLSCWSNIPTSVDGKFDQLFSSLHIPLPNEALKDNLANINNNTKSELLVTIQQHLKTMLETMQLEYMNLNHEDWEWAAKKAAIQAQKTYKRRVDWHTMLGWIEAEANLTNNNNHNTENTVSADAPNTEYQAPPKGIKRSAAAVSPSTTPTYNRFAPLSADDMDDDELLEMREMDYVQNELGNGNPSKKKRNTINCSQIATPTSSQINQLLKSPEESSAKQTVIYTSNESNHHEVQQSTDTTDADTRNEQPEAQTALNSPIRDDAPQQPLSSPTENSRSQPSRSKTPSPCKSSCENKGIIQTHHGGDNKKHWKLEPSKQTRVLILTDSIFRIANAIPDQWEIQAYSGANFKHINQLLQDFKNTTVNFPKLKTIIIAAGINNRNYKRSTNLPDHNKLLATMTKLPVTCALLGVSLPNTLSEDEKYELTIINNHSRSRLGRLYIEPLRTDEVSVIPNDPYKIHYDLCTVNKLLSCISSFLSQRYQRLHSS